LKFFNKVRIYKIINFFEKKCVHPLSQNIHQKFFQKQLIFFCVFIHWWFHISSIANFSSPLILARNWKREITHTLKSSAMLCLFILSSHQVKDDDFRRRRKIEKFQWVSVATSSSLRRIDLSIGVRAHQAAKREKN
jgi:hypothetical protein